MSRPRDYITRTGWPHEMPMASLGFSVDTGRFIELAGQADFELDSRDARRLAAWLVKAAEWVEQEKKK